MKASARVSLALIAALCFTLAAQRGLGKSGEKDATTLSPGLAKLTARDTPLRPGEKIAFFGDSVTMQGGYLRMIGAALGASENTKGLKVQVLQHGLNGGRVPTVLEGKCPWGDLGGSMESLIAKEQPTVVVIYLGINDVWHGAKGTTKPDYEAGLKKMVSMAKKAGATVVLCTPTVIGEEMNGKNALNEKLGEYADIVRKIAAADKTEKLALCDLYKAFVEQLTKVNTSNRHSGNLTYDGVHMNEKGNELLADQISLVLSEALKSRPAR